MSENNDNVSISKIKRDIGVLFNEYFSIAHWLLNASDAYQLIGLVGRVFAKGQGDWGAISDWVIPKTQKMVPDATLLNIQHYKVQINGGVEQSRERSSNLPYISV